MDVEVGGRNLIADSDKVWTTSTGAENVEYLLWLVDTVEPDSLRGKDYTLSFGLDTAGMTDEEAATAQVGMVVTAKWDDSTGAKEETQDERYVLLNAGAVDDDRVSITEMLTPPEGYDTLTGLQFTVRMDAPSESDGIYVWELSHPKFEYGTTATDWTPAPEDLKQQVTDATTQLDNKITNDLETNYATKTELQVEKSTIIQQTDEKISFEISEVNSSIDNTNEKLNATTAQVTEMRTYFSFTDEGLRIGQSGSTMTLLLSNDRISFEEGIGNEVAYISNNKLYITHAQVLNSLTMEDFMWEPQSGGNYSLVYKGQ